MPRVWMACEHKRVRYSVKLEWMDVSVGRQELKLQERTLLVVLKVRCSQCHRHYVFKGDPGFSTRGPMVSVDHEALRAPLFMPEVEKGDPVVN